MHVNVIFFVAYTLPLPHYSPSPGNRVLRMKLKVDLWVVEGQGCVSRQSIGHYPL